MRDDFLEFVSLMSRNDVDFVIISRLGRVAGRLCGNAAM